MLIPNWGSQYDIVGVTRDAHGDIRLIVEQPRIEGKELSVSEYLNSGYDKVVEYFEKKGLKPSEDKISFYNDKYYVSDIHYENVLFDKAGNPHIIDADVKLNEKWRKEHYGDNGVVFRTGTENGGVSAHKVRQRKHAQQLIDDLGGNGKVVGSEAEFDAAGKSALRQNPRATGWYNPETGEVTVYLPNCHSDYEAQRTVIHEKVGHEGLCGLMGEDGCRLTTCRRTALAKVG